MPRGFRGSVAVVVDKVGSEEQRPAVLLHKWPWYSLTVGIVDWHKTVVIVVW